MDVKRLLLAISFIALVHVAAVRQPQHRDHQLPSTGTIPLPHTFSGGSLPFSSKGSFPGSFDNRDAGKLTGSWGDQRRKDRVRKPATHSRAKPNVILILTDDQDIELGSMNYMPKTLRILGEGGSHFPNAYVTTPMCCPSRSSMLTGLYVHNHNIYTNNDNCSATMWQQEHEPRTFATYLSNAGYRTAYFGKYLNEYNGSYIPPGWREWAALIRNSRFYNYTINLNGNKVKHGNEYHRDYYPDLIANDSITFLRQSKQFFVNKPVMMVLSFPTPHGPEDAAPQYQNLFQNVTTHRTPSWNFAPNPDKQWLLRHTGKMEPIHVKFTDVLHTKRLQTLQSVDDAVEKLYMELSNLGELDNTYIFYTSDHGYHLGQFGLVKGKSMPFEFDIRVPFYVKGPRVPPAVRISDIVLNVDLAPTFLDIAGVAVPEHMDGRSILPLLAEAFSTQTSGAKTDPSRKKHWRDSFLIERGKVTKDFVVPLESPLLPHPTKEQRLALHCRRPEFASPCQPYQKWECYHDGYRWRLQKCRVGFHLVNRYGKNNCICVGTPSPDPNGLAFARLPLEVKHRPSTHVMPSTLRRHKIKVDPEERRLQRRFLQEHVGKDFKPVFLGSRPKRKAMSDDDEELPEDPDDDFDVEGVYRLSEMLDLTVTDTLQDLHFLLGNGSRGSLWEDEDYNSYSGDMESSSEEAGHRQTPTGHSITARSLSHLPYRPRQQVPAKTAGGCSILSNSSISCQEEVYRNPRLWRQKKERLDNLIKKLRNKLDELKGIRRHLKKKRPLEAFPRVYPGDILDEGQGNYGEHCICDNDDVSDFRQQKIQRPDLDKRERRDEDDDDNWEDRKRMKEEKLRKKERKMRRKSKFEHTTCNMEKMNCFTHDNDHWKTAPYWTQFQ